MRFLKLTGFMIAVLAFTLIPLSAQDSSDLYFVSEGDLWAWNQTMSSPERLTEWGYNGSPVLSPDGNHLAYLSVASEAVNQAGGIYTYGTPAMNIWLMNTANRDFTRIADQADNYPLLRGIPAWSPTGDELAWIEYDSNAESYNTRARLRVYNFENDYIRSVGFVNLGFQDAGIHLPTVQWGPGGISYLVFTYVESGDGQLQLHISDPTTGNQFQYILYSAPGQSFGNNDIVPRNYVWLEHNARAMIAILNSDGSWVLLDPLNGSQVTLSEAPMLMPRNGNSAHFSPEFTIPAQNIWEIRWSANANDTVTALPYTSFDLNYAIPAMSPDGTVAAWVDDSGSVNFSRIDGTQLSGLIKGANPDNSFNSYGGRPVAVWTPMRWITTGTTGNVIPTPVLAAPITGTVACDLAEPFAIGDFITVTAGIPNNLRDTPSLDADYIGSLFPGDLVSVSGGAVCADGYRWWNVSGDGGFTGWTVEGSADGNDTWLIRLAQSPLLNNCPLAPRLSPGTQGIVLVGTANVLRDTPDVTGTNIIGQIPANAEFTVLGYSLCGMDGRRWYPVEYNGFTGWTAEGEGDSYWIAPVE